MRRSFSGEIDREIAISDHKRESASQQRREMEAMTTPPPDTKVQGETLEQIAQRIATRAVGRNPNCETRRRLCEQSILSALRNERERAVDIARGEDCGLNDCLCATRIAAMIREGR